MTEAIKLKINGQVHEGWQEVSIRRSLNSLCSAFTLALTERWPTQIDRRPIKDGAACELWIDDELLISGFIDDSDKGMDANSHTVTASGRDRSCDLIDCSATNRPGTWYGQTLERIAADLVKPFGLSLKVEAPTGAVFAKFAIEPGETVIEALHRLCRLRSLLIKTEPSGNVIIFRPNPKRAGYSLSVGGDILRIGVRSRTADRFSEYILKGQHTGAGRVEAVDATGPAGRAVDKGVQRFRPLVIISNEQATRAGLQARAEYEATMHMAEGLGVSIDCVGWRDPAGALWAVETLVPVEALELDVDTALIIVDVVFTLNDQGERTQLFLTRPEAFTTEAVPEPKNKKGKGKKAEKPDLLGELI